MPREKIHFKHPLQKIFVSKITFINLPSPLLLIISDYTRENWGYFPLVDKVEDLNLGGCSPNCLCGIMTCQEDEFWKREIEEPLIIKEWIQLPNLSNKRKYYFGGDCYADPQNHITPATHPTGKIVWAKSGKFKYSTGEPRDYVFYFPEFRLPKIPCRTSKEMRAAKVKRKRRKN